jgi:predicted DNA-binding antitoxin AbrB/MazE fold protein
MTSVEAEYQDGVLRPISPLRLRQGERVHLIVKRQADPSRWNLARLAKAASSEDHVLASVGLEDWAQALKDEDGG